MKYPRLCSLGFALALSLPMSAAHAAGFPCQPCAGVRLGQGWTPEAEALLPQAKLPPRSPLFVAWEVPAAEAGSATAGMAAVAKAGATPWITLVFATPSPLTGHAADLAPELAGAAALAAQAPAGSWFQIAWRPAAGVSTPTEPAEYAFLLKRAAVALTGARADAQVATEPLAFGPEGIKIFYGEESAAYVDAVALPPQEAAARRAALAALAALDPGKPVVVDALPFPAEPGDVLAAAARNAAAELALTLFATGPADPTAPPTDPGAPTGGLTAARLSPLALLARELAGDLSYDPGSAPSGAAESWAFVRGKDLAVRVIAVTPAGSEAGELRLTFADRDLRRPSRFPYAAGAVPPPAGQVTPSGLEIRLGNPGHVAVVGLERATVEEKSGVAEKLTVASERDMPVEEILRRLQGFEDAQARKLTHYQAKNTTHLRFQPQAGNAALEATLEGPFFFDPEGGADWAWQTLYVNGVKWRGKTLPEIPLIQPEKAAALPLEIHFAKQYRYRLRGTGTVGGRDAWVIDFAPEGPGEPGKLYQGTVWVDRQIYSRLKTRAVQIGMTGEILSNEETLEYSPIDAQGRPAAWSGESFVLPLRRVAQQILSVVNAATVVERETLLSEVRLNGADFAERKATVAASDLTMVRDTDKGLRYLVKDDGGQRVVKEGFDSDKLFAAGGVFYDDALDYPLPLAGLNYFSFDFRGTGQQVNVFFAGLLLTANVAQPRLFGSRFDAGASAFALAVPFADTLYRDGEEVPGEEVKSRPASFSLKLGHPLGNFVKLNFEYGLGYYKYSEGDETDPRFVLPSDNLLHSLELGVSFARSGYRLAARGSANRRSTWDFWGLPGSSEWDADDREFVRYELSASKNWYLPSFQKVGLELDYSGGSHLDRFSKYQFGFFGGTRVHGYQSGKVRAEKASLGHLSYGFEIGQAFRLEGVFDAALATDKASGLDNEFLGGAGLVGTFIGPWQTVVNLDLGVPVAGPDDGFVAYIVFLKLFK
jgi:hypothetical protein